MANNIYIYMTWVVKTYEDLPELMAIDCNVKNDDTPFAFGMLYFQICIHKYIHIYIMCMLPGSTVLGGNPKGSITYIYNIDAYTHACISVSFQRGMCLFA